MSEDTQAPAATAPEVKPNHRQTIILSRFVLRTNAKNGGEQPSLTWGLYGENPRIIVRTNDPSDEQNNYGKIISPMDPDTFGALMNVIEMGVKKEAGWKEKLIIKNKYKGNEKFDVPTHINTVEVGKDAEGALYIMVDEPNRPSIKFYFGPSEYHHFVKANGEAYTRVENSLIYARAYVGFLSKVMGDLIAANIIEKVDLKPESGTGRKNWQSGQNRPAGGGQGGGGYQKGNYQGGGGYQKGGYQKGNYQGGGNRGGYQGGGGGYQKGNYNNNGGGGYQQRQQQAPAPSQQQNQAAVDSMELDDLQF